MNKPSECCTDVECKCSCRNNYFDGKRLTTDSFRVEQRYLLERRRLLNRSVLGWGVVYGFAVSGTAERLTIGAGLALDECGRELVQCGERQVAVKDILVADDQGAVSDLNKAAVIWTGSSPPPEKVCWLLSAHYAEELSGPVTVKDGCSCEHEEWERTCETVRYSLKQIMCGDCCHANECKLHCDCGTGPCCGDKAAGVDQPPKRGGCRCLCDYLTSREPGPDCCPLTEVDEACGRVRVDLRNGVPLACVNLLTGEIDACGPRQLVKGNDLLFDLIQGCDLTRIIKYGWEEWHRRPRENAVTFKDFSEALGPDGKDQDKYITKSFWVAFSRPVRKSSLLPDCFAITAMNMEREGGWWPVTRAPIVELDTKDTTNFPPQKDDPPDCVRGATVVVDGAWLEDAVRGRKSIFIDSDTYIEIEVRGKFIVDCNGQPIGDTFLSTFWIAATGAKS